MAKSPQPIEKPILHQSPKHSKSSSAVNLDHLNSSADAVIEKAQKRQRQTELAQMFMRIPKPILKKPKESTESAINLSISDAQLRKKLDQESPLETGWKSNTVQIFNFGVDEFYNRFLADKSVFGLDVYYRDI